ncbi:hypothetical protein LOC54_09370 [Acetobacter sp. AN02]|uniref:hypothetical protein n=1 Tax=Acetobacter sp. AN02 TaxID=2894186 RepID=UPI00243438F9|nr:hypothetical protein [Acetobacter sp. AN02]MDG6095309.1 hypothetical protein [Acetobacter sp. AN02]
MNTVLHVLMAGGEMLLRLAVVVFLAPVLSGLALTVAQPLRDGIRPPVSARWRRLDVLCGQGCTGAPLRPVVCCALAVVAALCSPFTRDGYVLPGADDVLVLVMSLMALRLLLAGGEADDAAGRTGFAALSLPAVLLVVALVAGRGSTLLTGGMMHDSAVAILGGLSLVMAGVRGLPDEEEHFACVSGADRAMLLLASDMERFLWLLLAGRMVAGGIFPAVSGFAGEVSAVLAMLVILALLSAVSGGLITPVWREMRFRAGAALLLALMAMAFAAQGSLSFAGGV